MGRGGAAIAGRTRPDWRGGGGGSRKRRRRRGFSREEWLVICGGPEWSHPTPDVVIARHSRHRPPGCGLRGAPRGSAERCRSRYRHVRCPARRGGVGRGGRGKVTNHRWRGAAARQDTGPVVSVLARPRPLPGLICLHGWAVTAVTRFEADRPRCSRPVAGLW